MSDYYLLHEDGREEGPFDYVAMVRKIKNRSLTPDRKVKLPDGRTLIAGEAEEFTEFFNEQNRHESGEQFTPRGEKIYSLKLLLRNGVDLMTQQTSTVIAAGVFLLIAMVAFVILQAIPGVGRALGFTVGYIFFGGFCFTILRKARGQAVELAQVTDFIRSKIKPLAIVGAIISVPFVIGVALPILLILPLAAMTLFAFTPFLLAERDLSAVDAIEHSRKRVMAMDMNNIAIVLAFMLINAVGALLVIGLVFTLPVTMLALAEMYDELMIE